MKRLRKRRKKKKENEGVSYSLECSFLENGNINKALLKMVAVLMVVSINWAGILAIGKTLSYFNDIENSPGNTYTASVLDFFLSEDEFNTFIGKEALGEYSVASVVIPESGSLETQYMVDVERVNGDDDFCNGLELEVVKNGIEVHDADVFSFSTTTSTVFGTWEFEFDLPSSVTTIGHGDVCEFDIVYTGWRADSTPGTSGFDDEERISFFLTSKMIVMNEILPDPMGDDWQDGFLGEWVELYNNGDTAVDVAGWVISELSDPGGMAIENFYTIVAGSSPGVGEVRTSSGNTVIAPDGFLVIVFDAARLNNNGDTVTFYDSSLNQMDQYRYLDDEAPENKSIARIPDGIGSWVDPIPTPGRSNILEIVEPSRPMVVVEEDIIIDLPSIDIIETTTPSDIEILPMPEILETTTPSIEEVIVIKEKPIEDELEPKPEPEPEPEPLKESEPEPEPESELNNAEEDDEE